MESGWSWWIGGQMCQMDRWMGRWAWKPRQMDMVWVPDGSELKSGWVGRQTGGQTDRLGVKSIKSMGSGTESGTGPAGGWDRWPVDCGGRWQPWVGGDNQIRHARARKIENLMKNQ